MYWQRTVKPFQKLVPLRVYPCLKKMKKPVSIPTKEKNIGFFMENHADSKFKKESK
jgi:hypothetical protein